MNAMEALWRIWSAGDAVARVVLLTLVVMSVASWYLILAKTLDGWRLRRAAAWAQSFWRAQTFDDGVAQLDSGPFHALAEQGQRCAEHCDRTPDLASRLDASEQIERALRQQYARTQAQIENGLTWLATTGATAPFVGLFGTVWGIYHALVAIGTTGQASLDKVAGPVGEALIMTALGLSVALPAVFAYNAFARANRVCLAELDAFAHDLHAFLTVGRPLSKAAGACDKRRAATLAEAA
ncbi:MotA/TolQ/ExbB proton channel family protein [Aquabacterium sp.]|uniref:MotA/TolQ/ExbB proton channel family protein n=1 Tax=Aquabacterium sp. TaxID=1872578 RepID=UPI0035B462FC